MSSSSSSSLRNSPPDSSRINSSPETNFRSNRLNSLRNMPQNSCSIISILDCIQNSNFLQSSGLWALQSPSLANTLKNRINLSCFKSAADQVLSYSRTHLNMPLQMTNQDPWLQLNALRHMLLSRTLDDQSLPVLQISCRLCSLNQTVKSDLQYNVTNKRAIISDHICSNCGAESSPQTKFLPAHFFVRMSNYIRTNTFQKQISPRFQNYDIRAYIQFNDEQKHFRTIRFNKTNFICLDRSEVSYVNFNQLQEKLDQDHWSNYILLYSKKDSHVSPGFARRFTRSGVLQGLVCGGSFDPDKTQQLISEAKKKNQIFAQSIRQRHRNMILSGVRQESILAETVNLFTERINQIQQSQARVNLDLQNQINVLFQLFGQNSHADNLALGQPDQVGSLQQFAPTGNVTAISDVEVLRSAQYTVPKTEKKRPPDKGQDGNNQLWNLSVRISSPGQSFQSPNNLKESQRSHHLLDLPSPVRTPGRVALNAMDAKPLPEREVERTQRKTKPVFIDDLGQGLKNEIKGDPEVRRMSELIMLPENSCAFTTAIDMVRYSNFLKKVDVKEQKFPELIKTLKLQSDSNVNKTIREIYDWGLEHNADLQLIGRYQDPWIIVNCILLMLAEIEKNENEVKDLLPILECSCRNQNKLRLRRNPEYSRDDSGYVKLRNLLCQYCGQKSSTRLVAPGAEFFVRVLDLGELKAFAKPSFVKINRYFQGSVIQFNKQQQHFRFVKLYGKNKIKLIDGMQIRVLEGDRRQEALNDRSWKNYVISMNPSNSVEKNETSVNMKCESLAKISQYMSKVLGGSLKAKTRVLEWNIQSLKNLPAVKVLKQAVSPDIMIINEARSQFQLSSMVGTHSLPAQGRNSKRNVSLFVREQWDFVVLQRKINYVSVITRNLPDEEPTIIVGMYINPSHQEKEVNAKLEEFLEEDIEYMMNLNNCNPRLIVGGDFNLSTHQMRVLSTSGSYLYSFLLDQCNKSEMLRTLKNRTRKQVDHIFCTDGIRTLKLEHVPQASDHVPVIVEFETERARQIQKTEMVPNIVAYKQLYDELMSMEVVTVERLNEAVKRKQERLLIQIPKRREKTEIDVNKLRQLSSPQFREKYFHRLKMKTMYRLGYTLLLNCGIRRKHEFIRQVGIKFKIFCRLPMTTANRVLKMITGDLERKIQLALDNQRRKRDEHINGVRYVALQEIRESDKLQFPNSMTQMLRLLYGSKCREHNHINNSTHLKQHGLNFDPARLLIKFQKPRNRSIVMSLINGIMKAVNQLKASEGRRRGRRWN